MKKLILACSFLFFVLFQCNHLNSQTIIFLGYESESFIPVDTVVFGFANNATIGIDEALGEMDITDTPIDSFDLRVIQRTAEDFECLFDENAEPIHFSTSFESKINLRPVLPDSEENNSLYFEVINYSTKNFTGGYDILLVDYKRDLLDPLDEYFMGFQSNFDCAPDNNSFLGFNLFGNVSDPLVSLLTFPKPFGTDDWYTHFYFKLERDITTHTEATLDESLKIYPNPADDYINVEGYDNQFGFYQLYSAQGQLVKQGDLLDRQTKIGTEDLAAGLYVLKLISANKNSDKNHRIIIQ